MTNAGTVRMAAVVVACAVALACAGCGGTSGSGGGAAAPPPTAPVAAAVTQVLTFQAFDDRGLLPGLVRAASVPGSCTGGSLVVAGRGDAWRCTAGGTMLDPCFSAEGSVELACVPDPFTSGVTALQLAGPLPRGNRNDAAHPPWFLELADGSRCGPPGPDVAAGAAAAGRRLTYACAGGLAVFGDPDSSSQVWKVQVGPAGGSAGVSTVDVKVAWY